MNKADPEPLARREEQRRFRRDAILDVAATSFLEHGYAATTMSSIAAALGGSKGTLWSYFPSKERLFEAVIDRATAAFRTELTVIFGSDDDLRRALCRFCSQFLAKITSPEAIALNRLVVGEVARFPELGRIFYERAPRQTQQLVAAFLARAMASGALRAADPLRAAQQLTALCTCGSYQQVMMGLADAVLPEMLRRDVDDAVETFLASYGRVEGCVGRP